MKNNNIERRIIDSSDDDRLSLESIGGVSTIIFRHSPNYKFSEAKVKKGIDLKEFIYKGDVVNDDLNENDTVLIEFIRLKDGITSVKDSDLRFLFDLIKKTFDFDAIADGKEQLLIDLLEKCVEIFDREKGKLKDEDLIGLMGELLVIRELENNGVPAMEWFHDDENMEYDLYAHEYSKYIEIKSTSRRTQSIKVKHHQLTDMKDYTLLISTQLNLDDNGKNIVEVMEELLLNAHREFKDFLEDHIRDYKEYPNIMNKKFNIEQTKFKVYEVSDLPKVEINMTDRISNISYDINTIGITSYEIDELERLLKK